MKGDIILADLGVEDEKHDGDKYLFKKECKVEKVSTRWSVSMNYEGKIALRS